MTITGKVLRDAIISGANNISRQRQAVDELNVFPVPDGDTGTNMSMTIKNATAELKNASIGAGAGDIAKIAASAMLRGARGNSGVILSLIFRGLSKGLAGKETADAAALSAAFKLGVDAAYKSVMKPTEGTILTVAREGYENTASIAKENGDAADFLKAYIAEAEKSLEKTPELLPALKKAGVVDAGGKGLIVILEGMYAVISGGEAITAEDEVKPVAPAAVAASGTSEEEIKFAYCTEFIINRTSQRDATALRAYLETIGDCVVVVDDEDIIKVHVHSNNPGKAIEEALKFGELTKVKIENMREQHNNIIKADKAAQKHRKQPVPPEKDIGFVAVAAGAGLEALFSDLGADYVVRGGQTMNPSTEDILEAIEQTPAHNVFVLPNNKNIIMAAEQCIPLCEDKKVVVIPTKTVPQGIAAMMAVDPDAPEGDNTSAMTEALSRVATSEITYAARDSDFDGFDIKQGDYLALVEHQLFGTDQDLDALLDRLANAPAQQDAEFISIFYGADVTEEEAQKTADIFSQACPGAEVTLLRGGQPVYYYMISAE